MAGRYSTKPGDVFERTFRAGLRECARVARLGLLCKITDQTHGGKPFLMTRWCCEELGDAKALQVIPPNRPKKRDRRPQRSPWSNAATYLYWRHPRR